MEGRAPAWPLSVKTVVIPVATRTSLSPNNQ